MTITVNNDQKALIDQIAQDSDETQRNGIVDSVGAPYAPLAAPYPKYGSLVPPGSSLQATALDGFKSGSAALVTHIGPVYWQKQISPLYMALRNGQLFSETLPFQLGAQRVVQACLSMSLATASASAQNLGYWIQVNSQAYPVASYYYPASSGTYANLSGTWLLTIPTGPVTISLNISATAPEGIIADPGYLSFTFMG